MGRSLRILAAGAVIPWLVAAALAGGPTKKTPQGPVTEITQKMTVVAGDLGKVQTGEPVQTKEKAIVGDLDELIAELEKQCAACRGGIKKNNPSRGMADSMISGGTGGIGDLVAPGESAKDWAKLSGRERDRILQSMSEGFPPEYRLVLERYYRRLAEEKAAPSGGDSPQAKPKAESPKAETP
jgi:hypothetical protein